MKPLEYISLLLYNCKKAEPISNRSDYTRVKNWVNKATVLYVLFTVIAVIVSVTLGDKAASSEEMPLVVVILVAVLTGWGFATAVMNFKWMFKAMWSAGAQGYRIGEQIQTRHIDVTHEYGNTYKVTSHTENQGCAVAMIQSFINLCVWCFLCVYVCPFLSFKKISDSKKNLRKFEMAQRS